MLGKLRARYQKAIAPVGTFLAKLGFSPNTMTGISLLVAGLAAYAYILKRPIYGALLILLTGVVDMFDGAIARAIGRATRFGTTLDHVTDRYAEFVIVLGILLGGYAPWISGLFILFGMVMASYTRAKAESVGGLKTCTIGIAERQEKLLLMIGGSILSPFSPALFHYALLIVGILSHVTVIQRLRYTWIQTGGN